jgi:hypothetical protein
MKEDEIGQACSTNGGNKCTSRCTVNFKGGDHSKVIGTDGRITVKSILRSSLGGMDWTDLAQDRD